MNRGVVLLAVLVAGWLAASGGCVVRRVFGPRTTGTCDGACEHYLECKDDRDDASHARCVAECAEVFADEISLAEFERLSCRDTVEFVDGRQVARGEPHQLQPVP